MPTQHADATASTAPLMLEDKHDNHDVSVTTLDMSSGSASVELGPVVVNEDGTLSRITNWLKMTESERKNTMRVLAKRNKSRLEALKAREDANPETKAAKQEDIQATEKAGPVDDEAPAGDVRIHREL